MTIKIGATLTGPDPRGPDGIAAAALKVLKKGVTGGIGIATRGMTLDLRKQITAAGLGSRLPNAIRGVVYPGAGKSSLRAAGFIYPSSKGAAEILDAFSLGVTIRARPNGSATFLAIPTAEARKYAGGNKITPAEWEQKTGLRLRYVFRGGHALLVAEMRSVHGEFRVPGAGDRKSGRRLTTVVVFVLVKQVRLKKRLKPEEVAQAWADRVPGLIERIIG